VTTTNVDDFEFVKIENTKRQRNNTFILTTTDTKIGQ